MKKILLFYPLVDKNRQVPNLPFSVLNLERMVRDLPVEVIIIDARINPDYKSIVDKHKDDIIVAGISAMIGYQIVAGREISYYIKENTNAKVVWGGWFVNVLPELALKEDFIDLIVHGQGEIPFQKLIEVIVYDKSYNDIKGIGYKINNKIIINEQFPIVNENEFKPIDFPQIDLMKIIAINGLGDNNQGSLNYIATIGCPYNCTFCCLATIWRQKTFTKEISTIIYDLKLFVNEYNVTKIAFDDDHFFGKKSFVIQLCEQILEQGIVFEWEGNAHIGTFLKSYSSEDLDLFYKSGCRSIRFGAESGDQEVLDRVNKKITVENCYEVAALLKKHNIKCVMYIMVAFPWNPDKDFKLTLKMVGKAKIINNTMEAGINFFVPLPKTPLYEVGIEYGFKKFESFDQIVEFIGCQYVAPWWNKNYRKELYDFIWFYFKYANPNHYKTKDPEVRFLNYLVNKFYYPICYMRLKMNFRKFRIDARIYFFMKKIFNSITNGKYSDDAESMARSRSWRR